MKKLVTIVFTVTMVIALFGAYHHVRAQGNERPYGPFKRAGISAPVVLKSHTLVTTYIDQGAADITLGSGFTGIDSPVTINCQSVGGCTIGAESSTEVGGQSATGVEWGICTYVDGANAGNCTYQGPVPSNDSYVTGFFNNAVAISAGTHTVQAVVFSSASGVFLAQYNNTYHLYRP
jgi:hypothetical protein